MRRIHRLRTVHFGAGVATRAISGELGISHSTVREYLARIAAAGITWPLSAEVTDQELERRLFVNGGVQNRSAFERRLSPSMRQTHVAGDKAFVDFSTSPACRSRSPIR